MSKKRARIIAQEPLFDQTAQDLEWEFFSCVNKYRTIVHPTTSKEKKWVSDYMKWKKYDKEDIEFAQKGNSFNFEMVAPCCRICTQADCDAPPNWQNTIDKNIESLIRVGKSKKAERDLKDENKPEKVVVTIQERMQNQVNEYMEKLNIETDRFLNSIKSKPTFDIANWLKNNNVKSAQSAMIAEEFQPVLQELKDAYDKKCEQLMEGYDFLTRPQLKKYRDLIQTITDTCNEHSKLVKAVRKPRRKKSRTPGQIIKKLKYCEKSDEYGVSSVDPRKIIGANKVILFNEKYRTLTILESSELVDGLSVKGTTIVGFDEKKSKQIKLREPKSFLDVCVNSGIRAINNKYKTLTTKETTAKGRVNGNTVIVKVIK
tara:strand:- start:2728 stop:3846 length:1119 start_codon:yes stop_codon:yes gene_type:complete